MGYSNKNAVYSGFMNKGYLNPQGRITVCPVQNGTGGPPFEHGGSGNVPSPWTELRSGSGIQGQRQFERTYTQCQGWDLNPRPTVYDTAALTAELPWQIALILPDYRELMKLDNCFFKTLFPMLVLRYRSLASASFLNKYAS